MKEGSKRYVACSTQQKIRNQNVAKMLASCYIKQVKKVGDMSATGPDTGRCQEEFSFTVSTVLFYFVKLFYFFTFPAVLQAAFLKTHFQMI